MVLLPASQLGLAPAGRQPVFGSASPSRPDQATVPDVEEVSRARRRSTARRPPGSEKRRGRQGLDRMRRDSCRPTARRPCPEPSARRRSGRSRVVRAFPWGACGPVKDADRSGHFANPATRLMDAEMMTTPRGYDSQAWRSASRRICLDSMLVSETWNVMPIVKDR